MTTGTIALSEGTNPVAGTTTCSGSTLTFTPALSLPTNTTLTATVNTNVTDLSSNRLVSPYTWSFGVAPWTRQIGSSVADGANALAIDTSGNLYVAGDTSGSFDGSPSAGGLDAVLVKYDKVGTRQWSRQFGTAGDEDVSGVVTDTAGNVYVGGYTGGNMDGSHPANGNFDGLVAKYDSSGSQLWVRQLRSTVGDVVVRAVATDPSGNVIAVGYAGGDLFAPNAGGLDLFVAKYDSSGALLWANQLGTAGVDNAGGVATDAAGNIYIAGYTGGSLDGGPVSGVSAILVKYDSSGAMQWLRQVRSGTQTIASAVAVDNSGNPYLGARTDGVLDGTANAGGLDAVVLKFDGSGTMLWARQFGSPSGEYAWSIAIDSADDVVLGGWTLGALDGNTSAGGTDAFIAKYDSAGTRLWLHQFGTAGNDAVYGVRVDAAGNIFAAGSTDGSMDGNVNAGGTDMFVVKYQADGTKR